jgi:DNA-binding response OmpR family regulator
MALRLRIFSKISDRGFTSDATEKELSLRDVIESGDFRIDITSRTVTLRGGKLELNFEEFDVLVFLVNRPHPMISRRTILATSWATNPPRQTEFLRVFCRSVRSSIQSETTT